MRISWAFFLTVAEWMDFVLECGKSVFDCTAGCFFGFPMHLANACPWLNWAWPAFEVTTWAGLWTRVWRISILSMGFGQELRFNRDIRHTRHTYRRNPTCHQGFYQKQAWIGSVKALYVAILNCVTFKQSRLGEALLPIRVYILRTLHQWMGKALFGTLSAYHCCCRHRRAQRLSSCNLKSLVVRIEGPFWVYRYAD